MRTLRTVPVDCNPEEDPKNKRAFESADRISDKKGEVEARSKLAQFGICWNCLHMRYTCTKYGKESCLCERYDKPDRPLSAADPVMECNFHSDKFAMSLSQMWMMATLINTNEPRVAGFVTEDEYNGLEENKALQEE